MIHVKQGDLNLQSRDVIKCINRMKLKDEVFDPEITYEMRFRRLCQHIWFIENYDKIEQPISTLVLERKVRSIHPGATRVIAASVLGKEYIDSIIVYDHPSQIHVRDIATNLRDPTSEIVLKPRKECRDANGNVHRNWEICVKEDYANDTQTRDDFFRFTENYVNEKHDKHFMYSYTLLEDDTFPPELSFDIVLNLHKLNYVQKIKFWNKLPEILKK